MESLLESAQRHWNIALARREFAAPYLPPRISFTFDDFPRSAYINGGRILSQYGARGTYYTSMGLMNTVGALGELFGPKDLLQLTEEGHELACHTFDHLSCRSASPKTCEQSIERNQRELQNLIPGYKLQNFAYPYGAVDIRAKRALGRRFATCRGTYPGANERSIDMALLRSHSLYRSTRWEQVESVIVENARNRSWLIFYTHDVREDASGFGCSLEFFEKVVKCAAASKAEILTIAAGVERLTSPKTDV